MGRPELKKEDKKVQRTIRISPKTYLVLEEKAALYNGGNIGKYLSLVVDKAILGTTRQGRATSLAIVEGRSFQRKFRIDFLIRIF